MCGIFGYIGQCAVENSMKALKKLEYRGYDSAGICFIDDKFIDKNSGEFLGKYKLKNNNFENNNLIKKRKKYKNNSKNTAKITKINKKCVKKGANNLFSIKQVGEISNLESVVKKFSYSSQISLAHTRWATHGKVSEENSHPHFSRDGKWAVVHNGIIENYKVLKDELENVSFAGQTDSEVIAHCLQKEFCGDVLATLGRVCQKLKGSFALGIIYSPCPDKIFVARKNSPVVVGCGQNFGLVCSDINALNQKGDFFVLNNDTMAVVEKGKVQIFDFEGNASWAEKIQLDEQISENEKGEYPHFMLKEIQEIPHVLENIASKYSKNDDFYAVFGQNFLKTFSNIIIIGCGTALHAGEIGGQIIEKRCKIKTQAFCASEFLFNEFLFDKSTLAIFVSQSGETADTLKAVARCKEKGLKTLAITNVKNGSICRECDYVLFTYAGVEVAVASTKAFNAQVAVFNLLASFLEGEKEGRDLIGEEKEGLINLAKDISSLQIDSICRQIAYQIKNEKNIYIIGRGLDYLLAKEFALKLKEISYIHCHALSAGELKHGTLSLIEKGSLVFALAMEEECFCKTLSNIKEVESRGAKVLSFSQFDIEGDGNIKIKTVPSRLNPIYSVIYMQKIAYYTALFLGNNPDKPRSLAKSVTVE